jgi:diacylglycerol kinase (ATP)
LKIAIILNGISRRKKFFYSRLLPTIQHCGEAVVFETQSPTDAFNFSAKAVSGFDLIIAAGGDGTLHQVVNGMLSAKHELPVLTVIPLGSGNDFARTVKITCNRKLLEERLKKFQPNLLDVGQVTCQHESGLRQSYFINEVSAGMGPEVLNTMSRSKKLVGSAITYYTAILSTFFSYRCMNVQIQTPEWSWNNPLRTFAFANGKFYGYGLCIAPEAKPDDGILSAFICGNVSVFDFIRYSSKLKNSKKINHPKIEYRSAKSCELTSDLPCRIEADGELLGFLPARIEVLPGRIKFLI